ncbi:ThiJ/PfpI family protein [Hypoxylon sp. FL1150]|nr:ThiJ/PfpI family protein [Hypoxylon sp. FL1150]
MAAANSSANKPTVRVGVFVSEKCQLLDIASVDVMGSMGHDYFTLISSAVPQAVIDLAPHVEIHYIGSVPAGEPIKVTSNESIVATNHYGDAEVAPGKLDILHIPGPDPFNPFDAGVVDWLRRHGNTPGVDILSVCSGILLCGEAGLLEGRRACGPRGLQDMIRGKGYGEKELVGHKYRWIQDGNIWSSGGVTNGNDLVAAYCRASRHFPTPLVEIVCEMVEVGDRAQSYETDMTWPEKLAKLAAEVSV